MKSGSGGGKSEVFGVSKGNMRRLVYDEVGG